MPVAVCWFWGHCHGLWAALVAKLLGQICAEAFLGLPNASVNAVGRPGHVLALQQPKAQIAGQIDLAPLVQPAVLHLSGQPGVGAHRAIGIDPPNPGGDLQLHKHLLGAILKIPAALWIGHVVAADELDEFFVLQLRALAVGKVAQGLGALVAHVPMPARIQAQPAVTSGHIWPFGHGLFDDIVHQGLSLHHCMRHSGKAWSWPGGAPFKYPTCPPVCVWHNTTDAPT